MTSAQSGEHVDGARPAADERSTQRTVLVVSRAVTYLAYAYLLFVEVLLAMGFFLLLAGANPTSSFVEWTYRSLERVMEPFRGIFTPIELGMATGNDVSSILETSVLFAMLVYGIVVIAVNAITHWLTGRIEDIDRANRERQLRPRLVLEMSSATGDAPAQTSRWVEQPSARPESAPPGTTV